MHSNVSSLNSETSEKLRKKEENKDISEAKEKYVKKEEVKEDEGLEKKERKYYKVAIILQREKRFFVNHKKVAELKITYSNQLLG